MTTQVPGTADPPGWMTPKRFFHITGICAMITAVLLYAIDGVFFDGVNLSTASQICDLVGDWPVARERCADVNLIAGLVSSLFVVGLVMSLAPFAWSWWKRRRR